MEDFETRGGDQLGGHLPGRELTLSKRANCDKKTNPMGVKLLDLCRTHDLQILNGRTTGDRSGSFTFYDTMQGASTIDVSVASDRLSALVSSFVVLPQTDVSPHCKIVTRIKNLKADIRKAKKEEEYPWVPVPRAYRWSDDSADRLSTALSSTLVTRAIIECNLNMEHGNVDHAAKKLEEVYTIAADASLEKKAAKKTGGSGHPFQHKQKPKKWYDGECRHLKNHSRRLAILKQQQPDNIELRTRSFASAERI